MRTLLPAVVVSFTILAATSVTIADDRDAATTDQASAASSEAVQTVTGMAAMQKAAKNNKYLFALFRKENDDKVTAMRQVIDTVIEKAGDRVDAIEVDVSAAAEKGIVDHFDVAYAPLPLLLAIAPNGAVTGGFPGRVESKDLMDAFASPGTAECLKAMQDRKLVLLCVQNGKTGSAKEAMQGVREFKADVRFAEGTELVVVDPTNKAESEFMSDLEIDPKTKQAVTLFLAPPGRCIGRFHGATNLDDLVATLASAMSGCGSCGPGSCGSCGPSGCGH